MRLHLPGLSGKDRCRECLEDHLEARELPTCAFPPDVERTYDRSFRRFARTWAAAQARAAARGWQFPPPWAILSGSMNKAKRVAWQKHRHKKKREEKRKAARSQS